MTLLTFSAKNAPIINRWTQLQIFYLVLNFFYTQTEQQSWLFLPLGTYLLINKSKDARVLEHVMKACGEYG
jgi:hypothetical protein